MNVIYYVIVNVILYAMFIDTLCYPCLEELITFFTFSLLISDHCFNFIPLEKIRKLPKENISVKWIKFPIFLVQKFLQKLSVLCIRRSGIHVSKIFHI